MAIANAGTNKYGTTRPSDNINPNDVLRDFLDAMAAAGIPAPDDLKTDTAEIQRFYIDGGKRNNKDGAYILHTDFPPNGGFQNHRGGEWIQYSYDWQNAGELGKQWYEYSRTEEGKAEMAAKEKERKEAAARAKAERRSTVKARFDERAKAPDPAFGYLISKKIEGERAEAYGVKQGVNDYSYQVLMLPYHNIDGEFMTYQEISADGKRKYFQCEVDGGFFAFGGVDALKAAPKDASIYIGEGFATVASVTSALEVTGKTLNKDFSAVSAGDAGKLKGCAEAIRAAYPERPIIFLADDDIKTKGNPGLTKANEAAAAVRNIGGKGSVVVVKPPFDRNTTAQAELSDWNDFYSLHINAGGNSTSYAEALSKAYKAAEETTAKTNTETIAKEKPRIRLESYDDIAAYRPNARWLIKDQIPAGATGCYFGEPESKKTFVAIDAAIAISTPSITDWHGYAVKQHGTVVYLSGEGNNRIRERIRGAVEYLGHEKPDFYLYPGAVSFDKGGAAEVVAELKRLNLKPVLFIVDTLRRYLDGDENDSMSIAQFLDGLESLKAEESTFLIISHPGNGKESKDRVRGSSSLRGAFDFEVKISTDSRGYTVLHSTKMKDAERPKDFALESMQVIIDGLYEEDGTPTSTLVFVDDPAADAAADAAEGQEAAKRERPLNRTLQALLQSFREAAAKEGELDDNGNFIGLHVEPWRPYAYAISTADSPAAKRVAFNRDRKKLVDMGQLTVKNNYYRPAGDTAEYDERQFAEKLKQRPPKDRQLLIGEAENDSVTSVTQRNKNEAETQHENAPKKSNAKSAKRSQPLKKEAENDSVTSVTQRNKNGTKRGGAGATKKASEKGEKKPNSRRPREKQSAQDEAE